MALHETTAADGGTALWVGTNGGGVARFDGGEWSVFDTSSGLPLNLVMSVVETDEPDGRRALWAATYGNGIAKLVLSEGEAWTVYDTSSGLPHDLVTVLCATVRRAGRPAVWIGMNGGGVARFDGREWEVLDVASGLPTNQVLSLLETTGSDGRRTLWVGTYGGGLAWRDPDDPASPWKLLSDATTPALPNNVVYQIRQDRSGRLYVCTNKGVARLTAAAPAADDPAEIAVETFTTENGLPSLECNSGASMVDSLGRVWVGTVAGAAVLDPGREVVDRAPKPLHVERVLVAGVPRELRPGARLAHDENSLEFDVTLLSYFRETDTRFRTQLVGFDRTPSAWSADFRRTYTNLPAGDYRFRVWGRDSAGNVAGPVERDFVVRPAPWKTWWAYALYGAAVATAGYAGVRYRTESLKRQRNELEATVAERTTELVETVEQLRASEQRALEASRAKSVFLSTMSHELRSPLNTVLGFAQLMEREEGRSDADRDHLEIIRRSGEHLLGLIDDALSISKIEAGRLALDERRFDPRAMLREVEAMMRARADAKGLALAVTVDPSVPAAARGDAGKLRQVLVNLLGNAVKFTDEGSAALRASWSDGRARFEIEDTGQGIGEHEIGQLFEPFAQTESGRRAKEGTGLGLAISREIVRLLGGDVAVRSAPGVGTTFSFEIDLPAAEGPEVEPVRRARSLAPGEPRRRVLVVDDAADNRLLLTRLLASVGLTVREAANGEEAVAEWESWQPHFVWMDLRMPVMDGYEATREIRRREVVSGQWPVVSEEESLATDHGPLTTSPCKIVALTANAFEHDRRAILEAGCDDFVAKPFSERSVFEALERHLDCRFVYDEPGETPPAAPGPAPDRLAAVEPALLARLREACETTDDLEALRAVDLVGERDAALADELRALVRHFEFDRLLDLLAKAEGRVEQ
jgi:signal transduction histidine kinase/DNA-binding response OmpR family regulator